MTESLPPRDQFALAVLQACLAVKQPFSFYDNPADQTAVARLAWQFADTLMAHRDARDAPNAQSS